MAAFAKARPYLASRVRVSTLAGTCHTLWTELVERQLATRPNQSLPRVECYQQKKTKILIFGASHAKYGLAPYEFTVPTMNLAVDGVDYLTLEPLIRGSLPRASGLEMVVLELGGILLNRDAVFLAGEDHRGIWEMGVRPWQLTVTSFRKRVSVTFEWFSWLVYEDLIRSRRFFKTGRKKTRG